MCVPAPACKAALAEATRLWPKRRRTSDGICPSAAHTAANPKSGHERGEAFDLSHDPDNGCDAHALAERVMRAKDERIVYVISNRRIWSRARYAEGWRPYNGSNPHESHAHFELDPEHRDSTWPWWPPAKPTPKEIMMRVPNHVGFCFLPNGDLVIADIEGALFFFDADGNPDEREYVTAYNAHPEWWGGPAPRTHRSCIGVAARGDNVVEVFDDGSTYEVAATT